MPTNTKDLGILDAWLERNRARKLWEKRVSRLLTVAGYQIAGQVVLVCRYGAINGFDVFVAASKENSVTATLDGAALALGEPVQGCRGLV